MAPFRNVGGPVGGMAFSQQVVEIEPLREHRQISVCRPGPRLLRSVPIEFHAVVVRVAQVKRLADAMIAGPVERDSRFQDTAEGVGQRMTRRIQDGDVVQPGCPRRRGRSPLALPGVQAEVMVVPSRRDERGLCAVPLGQLEAKDAAVEPQRPLQVGDLQMDVADLHLRVDRGGR